MRKSLVSCLKRACCWSACAWCSAGRSRGSCSDRAATMTSTSRTQPSRSASRIIRPSRGSIGSRASRLPIRVSRSSRSAPSSSSSWTPARDVAAVGRLDEREAGDVAEPERGHLQDDAGEVGAQDLGVGELRPRLEVLLGVEPDRDAGLDPAAAPGALVGRGLADRLDRQPLHLGARGVAADPGDAGVDDVADAGHGQRGLGHVGGEHDAAYGHRVARRRPGAARRPRAGSRAARSRRPSASVETRQLVGGVADLALAGQEDQHVARTLGRQLLDGVADRLGLVADDRLALLVVLRQLQQRPVADLDGVGATGDLDDRARRSGARTGRRRWSPR